MAHQTRTALSLILFLLVSCTARTVPRQAVVLVAHRGASHDAPENTLAAFELAWQLGADGVEGDFYLSADGVIVAHHDRATNKTAGVDRSVESQTLAELKALEVGAWKDSKWTGERIPTLDEVLAGVPRGKRILIEIKSDTRIVPALLESIERSDLAPEQMIVICFDEDVIELVGQSLPTSKCLWLSSFDQRDDGTWSPTIDEVISTAKRIGADGVDLDANTAVIDEAFVTALRRADLEFHVWTVNDPELARHLLALGVDSITTNRPGWLRNQLRSGDGT